MPDEQPTDLRNVSGRAFPLAIALSLVSFLGGAPSARAAEPGRELVIFEAASLKDVFARLAPRFEKDHAGSRVVTNAAGSQELRTRSSTAPWPICSPPRIANRCRP